MDFELENGLKLHLCWVSQPALDEIVDDLGGYAFQAELAQKPQDEIANYFRTMPVTELQRYNAVLRRQALYCLGFGVVDDPPDEAIALLQHLGKDSDIPQIRRAHWLLYITGMTRADKNAVIGAVMALTRLHDGG